jgi:hypothetical protein
LHLGMTLSICECELPINSTDEPVGPKTAGSLLDVSPVVATAVHGPLDHAVSSWSGQHEAMKAALESALDTLGLGGSVKWSWQLKMWPAHFSGQQGSWLRCFRELQILKQRHVSRGNTAAAQQDGRGPCREGTAWLRHDARSDSLTCPFGGNLVGVTLGVAHPHAGRIP